MNEPKLPMLAWYKNAVLGVILIPFIAAILFFLTLKSEEKSYIIFKQAAKIWSNSSRDVTTQYAVHGSEAIQKFRDGKLLYKSFGHSTNTAFRYGNKEHLSSDSD